VSPADVVIARLSQVRQQGKGWTARCPAHEDKGPSLSIAEGDDGRVLLHCFAGCSAADVVGAIGLKLADLFHERISDLSPDIRRATQQAFKQTSWAAALGVVGREAKVVSIAAHDLAAGLALSAADADRLALAIKRIDSAREVLA